MTSTEKKCCERCWHYDGTFYGCNNPKCECHTAEKKCTECGYVEFGYGPNHGFECSRHPMNLSEKPVQEAQVEDWPDGVGVTPKPVQDVKGFFEGKLIRFTPDTEEWEKQWDKKIKTYDKDGGFIVYVEGYENTDFDTDLMKSYISQLLQAEREKAEEEHKWAVQFTKDAVKAADEVGKEDGAKAERQRIEALIKGLLNDL